jgi:hemerythrin
MNHINHAGKPALNGAECSIQHIELTGLIKQLEDSIHSGMGPNMLHKLLLVLELHAMIHFETEETLMRERKYYGFEAHQHEHRAFINRVNTFRDKYDSGEINIQHEVLRFLKYWFTAHNMELDKELERFLAAPSPKLQS